MNRKFSESYIIALDQINPHPKNAIIYGAEGVEDLLDMVKKTDHIEKGMVSDRLLKKTGKYTWLRGHRRSIVCEIIGRKEVEVEIKHCETEEDELFWLLTGNHSRKKTNFQISQEAKYWHAIETAKAKDRMSNHANLQEHEKGTAIDKTAQRLGVGSRSLHDALKVSEEIDRLKATGREDDADLLRLVMNKAVSGASNLIKADFLNKADQELKDRLRNGDITTVHAAELVAHDYELTDDLLNRLFKNLPITAAKELDQCEVEFLCSIMRIPFFPYLWDKDPTKRMAQIKVILFHPKGLGLFQAYFRSHTARELLHRLMLESDMLMDLCRMFRIPGPYDNKEHAAALLAKKMKAVRYASIKNERKVTA